MKELKNRYILGDVMGEGSFNITYAAFDKTDRKKVAVKTSKDSDSSRLELEKDLALDFFEEDGRTYIVMEHYGGGSLADLLERKKRIPVSDALEILRPILESIIRLNLEGYVHGDVSPDNIMLDDRSMAHLIDYGAIDGGQIKEGYSAPELYTDDDQRGPWSDVYSFCAVLYCAITGRCVDSAVRRMKRDRLFPIVGSADISPEVKKVIMKGLSVEVPSRFFSPEMLLEELYGEGNGISDEMRETWGRRWVDASLKSRKVRRKKIFTPERKSFLKKETMGFVVTAFVLCAAVGILALINEKTDAFDSTEQDAIVMHINQDYAFSKQTKKEIEAWQDIMDVEKEYATVRKLTSDINEEYGFEAELTIPQAKKWGHPSMEANLGIRVSTFEKLYESCMEECPENKGIEFSICRVSGGAGNMKLSYTVRYRYGNAPLTVEADPITDLVQEIKYHGSRKEVIEFVNKMIPSFDANKNRVASLVKKYQKDSEENDIDFKRISISIYGGPENMSLYIVPRGSMI